MAKTMVHTCDICKQSKSANDLSHTTVKTEGIKIKDSNCRGIEIDICSDCLKKKGFVVEIKTEEELQQAKAKNSITLEDKIYEILQGLGVAFTE